MFIIFQLVDSSYCRTAQLIASSARCSKKRLFPLERFENPNDRLSDSAALDSGRRLKSKSVGQIALSGQQNNGDYSDSSVCKNMSTVKSETSLLGTSRVHPLRMLGHSRMVHGREQVFRFVGDKQPTTDIAAANVFNAHPQHKLVKVDTIRSYVEDIAHALVSLQQHQQHQQAGGNEEQAAARSPQQDIFSIDSNTSSRISSSSSTSIIAHGATADEAQTLSASPDLQTNSAPATAYRTVYNDNDESVRLAGTDAELPSAVLLDYIRSIATKKVANALSKQKAHAAQETASSCAYRTAGIQDRMDSTALVAVSVLVEELVRDMMVNWYQKGNPLGFDSRHLRTAALAQMNGAAQPRAISVELLQNRLEVRTVLYMCSHLYILILYAPIHTKVHIFEYFLVILFAS